MAKDTVLIESVWKEAIFEEKRDLESSLEELRVSGKPPTSSQCRPPTANTTKDEDSKIVMIHYWRWFFFPPFLNCQGAHFNVHTAANKTQGTPSFTDDHQSGRDRMAAAPRAWSTGGAVPLRCQNLELKPRCKRDVSGTKKKLLATTQPEKRGTCPPSACRSSGE